MDNKDLIDMSRFRQGWGTKKYGDADIKRDVAKDLLEEVCDITNISARRNIHLHKLDIDESIIERYKNMTTELCSLCLKQFEVIKQIDRMMYALDFPEDDVKRIYFDK